MIYAPEKEVFEKFSDDLKKEYTEKDGTFTLNLEGHEDAFVPKAKKDLAEQHRKEAEKQTAEAKAAIAVVEAREAELMKKLEASGKSTKDVEAIRKQHQEEIDKIKLEHAEKEKIALADSSRAMIEAEAAKFTGEKFTIPDLVALAYEKRLAVETVEGHQVLRVREADGSPSVKGLGDLQKEFLDNPKYASIVRQSSGSGGGANKSQKTGGGATGKTMSRSEFNATSQEARVVFFGGGGTITDD
jgi:hypothetical protein